MARVLGVDDDLDLHDFPRTPVEAGGHESDDLAPPFDARPVSPVVGRSLAGRRAAVGTGDRGVLPGGAR